MQVTGEASFSVCKVSVGGYTCTDGKNPVWVDGPVECPYCHTCMGYLLDQEQMHAQRVLVITKQEGEHTDFIGDPLPPTHRLWRCKRCSAGFTTLVEAGSVT